MPTVTSDQWTTVTAEFNEANWANLAQGRFEGYFVRNGGAINNEVINAYIDNISIIELVE